MSCYPFGDGQVTGNLLSVGIELEGGHVKEGWVNYSQWVPSMLYEGYADSRPGSLRVLEMMWMDRPGFSLCAAPLESSGPGFQGVWQDGRGRSRSLEYARPEGDGEDLEGNVWEP